MEDRMNPNWQWFLAPTGGLIIRRDCSPPPLLTSVKQMSAALTLDTLSYPHFGFQMDWVCDDAWRGPFSQSMFSVGALFGTILFGYVADTYGRLSAWYASNIVLMVAGLATPFMNEFIGFSCMRFLQGMSFDSFFTIFYVLGTFLLVCQRHMEVKIKGKSLGQEKIKKQIMKWCC